MSLTGSAKVGTRSLPHTSRTLKVALLSCQAGEADRLVQRLCLSFVNYATAYHEGLGQIRFPFGWCKVQVHGATLEIASGAEDLAGLEHVGGIVVERLKRVARRHRYELVWNPGPPADRHDNPSLVIHESPDGP